MNWPTIDELHARTIEDPDTGCLIWQGAITTPGGYGAVNRHGTVRTTHRLAWEAAYGDIPPGLMVMHLCDVPACIRPEHLSLGTATSNARQAKDRGRLRALRGEDSPKATLTNQDVEDIRALAAAGHRTIDLADEYDIHPDYASALIHHRRRTA